MNAEASFVVVGAGQAGGRAVEAMRGAGFQGRITLFGDEAEQPYERPPLSKKLLTGAAVDASARILGPEFYAEKAIELRLGEPIATIDAGAQAITTMAGERLGYDKLLLTTGARVRLAPFPGAELAGVHYLRTLEHMVALRAELARARRLVVVGGGYLGLEIAASARSLGLEVTVVELEAHLVARGAPRQVGEFLAGLHREHGVDIRTATRVEALDGAGGRVAAVALADGERLAADVVVVAIGILPNVELAAAAGAEVDDGIVVDASGRTSLPEVYAAGDATRHPNPYFGATVRLESWHNAQEQAKHAARAMCGEAVEYALVPWFWSDQFDLNLQLAGDFTSADEIVRRGEAAGPHALFYFRAGRLIGVAAFNQGRDVAVGQRLIARGLAVTPAQVADPASKLNRLVKG